jgi:hypothetical protein
VASNIPKQKQFKMKKLDAQVARVAQGGWDSFRDSPKTTKAAGVSPSGLECPSCAWQART